MLKKLWLRDYDLESMKKEINTKLFNGENPDDCVIKPKDLIEFIDKKLIMIPHYSDGESHLQYLERYKAWLKEQINGEN